MTLMMRGKQAPVTLTKRETDCLLVVESLSQDRWPARIGEVAHRLNVSTPSAVELVDRLQSKRMLERGPGGVRLSRIGNAGLLGVHRAHRLFENMFTRMGMRPEAACRESGIMDRHLSREALKVVCRYLGHPKTCPHDLPIEPDPSCCTRSRAR